MLLFGEYMLALLVKGPCASLADNTRRSCKDGVMLQVGAGGLKALAAAKAPMTMDEILEVRLPESFFLDHNLLSAACASLIHLAVPLGCVPP